MKGGERKQLLLLFDDDNDEWNDDGETWKATCKACESDDEYGQVKGRASRNALPGLDGTQKRRLHSAVVLGVRPFEEVGLAVVGLRLQSVATVRRR